MELYRLKSPHLRHFHRNHTGRPGNNGRLLTTRNCVLTRVGQAKTLRIWGMCVYAQRHDVYAENFTLLCKN